VACWLWHAGCGMLAVATDSNLYSKNLWLPRAIICYNRNRICKQHRWKRRWGPLQYSSLWLLANSKLWSI